MSKDFNIFPYDFRRWSTNNKDSRCVSFAQNQTRNRRNLPQALGFIESTSSGSRVRQYDQVAKHLRLPTDQDRRRTFSNSSEENHGLDFVEICPAYRPNIFEYLQGLQRISKLFPTRVNEFQKIPGVVIDSLNIYDDLPIMVKQSRRCPSTSKYSNLFSNDFRWWPNNPR